MTAADADHEGLDLERARDEALLAVLVHVVAPDGEVDDGGLAFLLEALPGRDPHELRTWVARVIAVGPLDVRACAEALGGVAERWSALRLAARAGCRGGVLPVRGYHLLTGLAEGLGLPSEAADEVLAGLGVQVADRVPASRLHDVLDRLQWGAVDLESGRVTSPELDAVVPVASEPVARIGLDGAEVAALFEEGLLARFREGPAFLPWRAIRGHRRAPGLGGGLVVTTTDGQARCLVDHRLGGFAALLDRVVGTRSGA